MKTLLGVLSWAVLWWEAGERYYDVFNLRDVEQ